MAVRLTMADATGRTASTIVPKIILVFAVINLLFLLTEIVINVFSAMLPL
jgi:hypothetical protein